MKLYEFPFSPNCRKVRAIAYELNIELEYERVNLVKRESRTPAFLAINPNGHVPVLVDGDLVLWESNAILDYLAHGSALAPTAKRERAEVDRWLFWQIAHLAPALRKVAYERIVKNILKQGEPDQARIAEGIEEFKQCSAVLDASLGNKEYVAGRLSIGDFALAASYSIAPSCGLDVTPYPRVNAWLDRVLSRESMKRTLADAQASLR
jgi:glutathione S-transferase